MYREQTAVTREKGMLSDHGSLGGRECAWERALGAGSSGPPALQGGQRWRCLPCVCESEQLRLVAFETYRALLAKVKRTVLVFPLKYQVLNLIVLLVLHLEDVNISVAQVRGQALEPGLPSLVVMEAGHQHTAECPGWEDSKEENPSIWHSASAWFSALGFVASPPSCSLHAPLH
ncbi:hypothetical protein GH733_010674 [Mirounga leonina]|nr:hypothetical protein GH733_010674 [Mirounga leonina]